MSNTDLPPSIDPAASARWAALPLSAGVSPWLHEEIAARMLQRLDFIKLKPRAWAHWEPLRGGLMSLRNLRLRYPDAPAWLASDLPANAEVARSLALGRWWAWSRWFGPALQVGTPPAGTVDMLWANMLLHQAANPQGMIQSWHRALAVDGFLMFSCFGPDTLTELRKLYTQKAWPAPAHEFTDMHDWGDMLVHAGFAEPVMDMERITLSYETPQRLLAELRELGRNFHAQRFPGLRGRRWHKDLLQALMALSRPDEQGRLVLTFEVVYGHALKPAPRAKLAPIQQIGLEDMRQMLRQPPPASGRE